MQEITTLILDTFNDTIFKMQPDKITDGESIFDE